MGHGPTPEPVCERVASEGPWQALSQPSRKQPGFGASQSLGQRDDANVALVTSWFLGKLSLDRLRVAMPLLNTPPPASSPAEQGRLYKGSVSSWGLHVSWAEGPKEGLGSDIPDDPGNLPGVCGGAPSSSPLRPWSLACTNALTRHLRASRG